MNDELGNPLPMCKKCEMKVAVNGEDLCAGCGYD